MISGYTDPEEVQQVSSFIAKIDRHSVLFAVLSPPRDERPSRHSYHSGKGMLRGSKFGPAAAEVDEKRWVIFVKGSKFRLPSAVELPVLKDLITDAVPYGSNILVEEPLDG
jgi:hypothetical protein